MLITVFGLWHLGCVTSGCTAAAGNRVVGLDLDESLVNQLRGGKPPIEEPGLTQLLAEQSAAGRLSFSTEIEKALADAEVVWVCFDTPVNDRDEADHGLVRQRIERLVPFLRQGTIILISSQVPAGFTRGLQRSIARRDLHFACSPENLRLGKAIEAFRKPERVIIGTSDEPVRHRLAELFAPFTKRIEWMSIESAEMTKHAINAFLATSVTFANELARLCEAVGADAREVERGLKSEGRIGPRAYLAPGVAFSGGTLARDLRYLTHFGQAHAIQTPLFDGVIASNERHKQWTRQKVGQLLEGVANPVVAVLGLTYKPGTDMLRRSAAVELCGWMHEQGYQVKVHDPAVRQLPEELGKQVLQCASARDALEGADLAVLATEWPEYRTLSAEDFLTTMRRPTVIDPGWFLFEVLGNQRQIHYVTTGRDSERL